MFAATAIAPQLDADVHRLVVDRLVERLLNMSVTELRTRFTHRTVTAVMQCAGNRRADMLQVAEVSGDHWASGAIGNAEWTGVALADVLQAAGATYDATFMWLSPPATRSKWKKAGFLTARAFQ